MALYKYCIIIIIIIIIIIKLLNFIWVSGWFGRSYFKPEYFVRKIGHIGLSECPLAGIHPAGKVR